MYNLTAEQEKKLREAVPNIDAIIAAGDIIEIRDVLSDQILDALDENQDPTDESLDWEAIYDCVISFCKKAFQLNVNDT